MAADFSTAYSRIAHPLVGKLAVQWLQGHQLTPGEMRDLGVTLTGIEKPEQAWLALRFLLEAFRRAELPFLFCLDEHERLTIRGSDEDQKASLGLLKDLAEVFTGTGHVLIISGVCDAWDSLPEDVYARIKREDIVEIALERSEGPKLLRAYAPELDKIISPKALDRLYDVSQYNARRLLDLAHAAYKVWSSNGRRPLGPEAIRDVTRSALGDRNRKASVSGAIEDCGRSLGLTVERDAEFLGVRFDFLLSGPARMCLLVQVSESAFLMDEIDHSREIIGTQARLAEAHDQVRTCAVMIGYSSPEIRAALQKVVDRVLLYDEASFRSNFKEFAAYALEEMSTAHPPVPVPQIASATRLLDSTELARAGRMERVKTALGEAGAPQQQRQEAALVKQIDEQMSITLSEVESSLQQETEHLVGLSTRGITNEQGETTLRALSFLNWQRECLRRARNISENDGSGPVMLRLFELYRNEIAQAENSWQLLLGKESGLNDSRLDMLRNSLAQRRELLHDMEERWLTRRRKIPLAVSNLPVLVPLLAVVLILTWLSLGLWQAWSARGHALGAFRQALTGLIDVSLGYQGGTSASKEFASTAAVFERAILDPAMPTELETRIDGVRKAVDRVREGFGGSNAQPSQESVTALRTDARNALEHSYRVRSVLFDYLNLNRWLLVALAVLVLWILYWQYLRHALRERPERAG
jgi:hypothetical protein